MTGKPMPSLHFTLSAQSVRHLLVNTAAASCGALTRYLNTPKVAMLAQLTARKGAAAAAITSHFQPPVGSAHAL